MKKIAALIITAAVCLLAALFAYGSQPADQSPCPTETEPLNLTAPTFFTTDELRALWTSSALYGNINRDDIVEHPARRPMTQTELEVWIEEYLRIGITRAELEVLYHLNTYRRSIGRTELALCPYLSMAARLQAQIIAEGHHPNEFGNGLSHQNNFYASVARLFFPEIAEESRPLGTSTGHGGSSPYVLIFGLRSRSLPHYNELMGLAARVQNDVYIGIGVIGNITYIHRRPQASTDRYIWWR